MRLIALKALAGAGLVLACSSLAAEEADMKVETPTVPEPEAEAVKESLPEVEDDSVKKPENFQPPAMQRPPSLPLQQLPLQLPMQQSQKRSEQLPEQQSQQTEQNENDQEKEGEQQLLLAALKFESLFKHMSQMQRRFFQAILPDSWAVPKFVPSTNTDLEQVHAFLRQVSETSGAPSIPATLVELAQSDKFSSLLQLYPHVPPLFRPLLSLSTSTLETVQKNVHNVLVSLLPTLEAANLEAVTRLFRIPSELEFPVSPDVLSLFLPVVVRNVAGVAVPLPEGTLQEVLANVADILIPVVNHEGQILFADAPSVFRGIELPERLPLRPLALFSALEVEDVNSLWSAVKAPVMSRLSLLGSDAPALFGPVMALASLPRVALSLNGESQDHSAGGSQLSRIVGDFSSQLRRALRSFQDLNVQDGPARSTQTLLRQPLEEFLNMQFLNFSIPIVGVPRALEIGAFTPFQALSVCTSPDCAVDSSLLPSFPEFLVSPETAISRLQERVQNLAMELQHAVLELQKKITSALPAGLTAVTDAHGVSLEEALNAALSLTGTLQAAVGVAGERVQKLLGLDAAAGAAAGAASAAKSMLGSLENPVGFYATLYGRRQQETNKAQEDEPGLLAPRRKLQNGLISLPQVGRGLDLTRLELPGQGSLEQLLSLRQITSAVDDFVPVEGSPLLSGISPSTVGKSLGSLFRENSLPESLLQQPLNSVLQDSSTLPSSLGSLNLGQFLSLSSALENIFSAPFTALPNLSSLALNPAALLSLAPGVQTAEKLFTTPTPTHNSNPATVTEGLFF